MQGFPLYNPGGIWNFTPYLQLGGYGVIRFGSKLVTKIPRFLGKCLHSPSVTRKSARAPDDKGTQIISYPVLVTLALQIPLKNDLVVVSKKVRLATKKTVCCSITLTVIV